MERFYKHITITDINDMEPINGKLVYIIVNNKSEDLLGFIFWEPKWNQFVFNSYTGTDPIFSVSCLEDIISFIKELK